MVHRYGDNGFFVSRLPVPRRGKVLGLVGVNACGKTTLLKVLTGEIQPNLGREHCNLKEVAARYRGMELIHDIFAGRSLGSPLKFVVKPQHLDSHLSGGVNDLLTGNNRASIVDRLDLSDLMKREFHQLSGGEKQRVAIAHACCQSADVYVFDEPSCFLDIKQRLRAAEVITSKAQAGQSTVILVEHDQLLLDYLADDVCILYGDAGLYGVCSARYNTREGLNALVSGYLRQENVRFRDGPLVFRDSNDVLSEDAVKNVFEYQGMLQRLGDFSLSIDEGRLATCEVTVLLGSNGAGKSTWLNSVSAQLGLTAAIKHQDTAVCFGDGQWAKLTVRSWLDKKIGMSLYDRSFQGSVAKPLQIEELLNKRMRNLSGGERQRVAVAAVLGVTAPIYFLDEPSANLDIEMRLRLGKVIKRFSRYQKVSVVVVEHDLLLAMYIADKVITFSGKPAVSTRASPPAPASNALNAFLKDMNITFRKDPISHRPRINKMDSEKDAAQKRQGLYFDQGRH